MLYSYEDKDNLYPYPCPQLADLCWSVEQACIDPDLANLADALLVAAELETGHRVGRTDLATACRQAQELIHQVIDPKPGLGRELGGAVDPDDVPGDSTKCWIGGRPVCGMNLPRSIVVVVYGFLTRRPIDHTRLALHTTAFWPAQLCSDRGAEPCHDGRTGGDGRAHPEE